MPLYSKREPRSSCNPDCFDRAILGDSFHDYSFTEVEYTLTVEGIHTNDLMTEQLRNDTACDKPHLVTVAEDNFGIGMELPVLKSSRTMIHTSIQLTYLWMERTAKCDVHLLEASADVE